MTTPRSQQISLADTPYYHCIGRCVRRAFLCGQDNVSGISYEHRRAWVQERLALLTEVFAIDLCAYAIMSNHYHLVLRINPAKSEDWSDEEVAARWLRLFAGPPTVFFKIVVVLIIKPLSAVCSPRRGSGSLPRSAASCACYPSIDWDGGAGLAGKEYRVS